MHCGITTGPAPVCAAPTCGSGKKYPTQNVSPSRTPKTIRFRTLTEPPESHAKTARGVTAAAAAPRVCICTSAGSCAAGSPRRRHRRRTARAAPPHHAPSPEASMLDFPVTQRLPPRPYQKGSPHGKRAEGARPPGISALPAHPALRCDSLSRPALTPATGKPEEKKSGPSRSAFQSRGQPWGRAAPPRRASTAPASPILRRDLPAYRQGRRRVLLMAWRLRGGWCGLP